MANGQGQEGATGSDAKGATDDPLVRAIRRTQAPKSPAIDPSEWVPGPPARHASARSFLPSRGLVASLAIATMAWGWVATCLASVDPRGPYALVSFLGAVAVGVAATLAPGLRMVALRHGRTRAFRGEAWWHGTRQGLLVGLAAAANGLLLAFRQWAPVGAVVIGLGVLAIEGIILLGLTPAPRRYPADLTQ